MHSDIATLFSRLLEGLHLNADSQFIHALVLKVDALRSTHLLTISIVMILYGMLLLAEGVGLWLEYRWAAYLTVVSTSLFIPFEIYENIERVTALRVGLLFVNVMIVLYLISQLQQHKLDSKGQPRIPQPFRER